MIDQAWKLLLFLKDFTGRGEDSFYWFDDGQLLETDAQDVVRFSGAVVCHDFWMIRDVLFDKTKTLPNSKHSPGAVWLLVGVIVYRVFLWTHTRTPPAFKFYQSLILGGVAAGQMTRRSGSLRKALSMA